jgi:hypothetical protein
VSRGWKLSGPGVGSIIDSYRWSMSRCFCLRSIWGERLRVEPLDWPILINQ